MPVPLTLRSAADRSVAIIADLERTPEFLTLIGSCFEEEHFKTLHDPNASYWLLQDDSPKAIGFALLQGLLSEHNAIELQRIVVCTPNQGFGKLFLNRIASKVFDVYGAHRLWLDVFEANMRAGTFI
jgi:diamine N-acetyltransferase